MSVNKLIDYFCPSCGEDNKEVLYQYRIYKKGSGENLVTLVICLSCNFIFNSPRPSLKEIYKHYKNDSSGAVYSENSDGSRTFVLNLERSEFIEKHCSNLKKGNFLDIGCGQGSLLKKLKIPQLKKHGLDPIHDSSNIPNDEIIFIGAFIEDYEPDIDKKYNAISCISSLEHYYNPNIFFKKLENLIDLNGVLILEVPDTLRPKIQLAEFFSFEHFSHFTKASLTRMLNFYCFDVIEFDKKVSIPNIRVAAKKIKNTKNTIIQKSEKLLIKETFNTYVKNRKLEIQKLGSIINPTIACCKKNKKNILIYGAGYHTMQLFMHFDLEKYVSNYIDGDPKKWGKIFRGKKIFKPSDIRLITQSHIIISSHDYEAEILNTIKINNPNSLEVTCLYNR
ncbi:methyltransferase domain-containing protein [Candidatus Pelagibacter ubique]|nr:methyltransferase domain-containing protein [Candidatus Pelagibacter ubique]